MTHIPFIKKFCAGLTLAATLCLPQVGQTAPIDGIDGGMRLGGTEKQAYIIEKMGGFFQPAPHTAPPAFSAPDGWTWEKFDIGAVHAERMMANVKQTDRVILQLHGGGYVLGMSDAHRLLAVRQATLAYASAVYYVDYRTAPEHVYPAALEDAATIYKEMLARGIDAGNIIFAGDSAGGNLAVELALYLKEHNLPLPSAIAVMSPWGTFEHRAGTSRTENAAKDRVLGEGTPLYEPVKEAAYRGTLNRKDPRLSPIYADLSGLPPMLIQAGGDELFLTDSFDLAAKAAADGVPVTLTVYTGMPHDFALIFPELRDSVCSLKELADFIDRYMDRADTDNTL